MGDDSSGTVAVSHGSEDGMRRQLSAGASHVGSDGTPVYRCQATRLYEATRPLAWWDLRQYWRDIRTGNRKPGFVFGALLLAALYNLRRLPVGYRASCWLYDRAHRLLRGQADPHLAGAISRGQPTPDRRLDLEMGEVVEIRSKAEIERTLDTGTATGA